MRSALIIGFVVLCVSIASCRNAQRGDKVKSASIVTNTKIKCTSHTIFAYTCNSCKAVLTFTIIVMTCVTSPCNWFCDKCIGCFLYA